MINIRRSEDRGRTKLDWLDSRHSFSFGDYYDEKNINFGKLIVFNEDYIEPKSGFGKHYHENAEIITIVLEGTLTHGDSIGNKGTIKAGEVQRMSAGTGIMHSEYNYSKEKVHLLQVWLEPKDKDIDPSYEQKQINLLNVENKLIEVASNKRNNGSLFIYQDAIFLFGNLESESNHIFKLRQTHGLYFFVIKGSIELNGLIIKNGDAAEISRIKEISFKVIDASKVLLIDIPLN